MSLDRKSLRYTQTNAAFVDDGASKSSAQLALYLNLHKWKNSSAKQVSIFQYLTAVS